LPPVVLQLLSAADSARLWALDQRCFPPGIAYSESEIRAVLLQGARGFHATIDDPCEVAVEKCRATTAPPAAFILSLLHRRRGHIITLDVAPEHRRRGLGLALMRAAEAHFRALGAVGMRLEAAVDNQAARQFYARLGYRETRSLPDYYAPGQHGLLLLKSWDAA